MGIGSLKEMTVYYSKNNCKTKPLEGIYREILIIHLMCQLDQAIFGQTLTEIMT